MEDFLTGLISRSEGPLHLRLLIQPLIAAALGAKDGLNDARKGAPPYFWAIFTQKEHRSFLIKDGWKSIGKVFILATTLDMIFQYLVIKDVRLIAAMVVAVILAALPYSLLRGPLNRILRRKASRDSLPAD